MADGKKQTLKLTDLVMVKKYQNRKKGAKPEHVRDLAADIKAGVELPAPLIYDTPDGMLVVGGHGRIEATRLLKRTEIECRVVKGTPREAFLASRKENSEHKADKLSNEDREHSVRDLLKDNEAEGEPLWSQQRIAEACLVPKSLVKKVLDDIQSEANTSAGSVGRKQNDVEKTVGKDGKARKKRHEATKAPRGPISLDATDWRSLPLSDYWESLASVEKAVADAGIECLGDLFEALNGNDGIKGVGAFQAALEIEKISKVAGFDGKIESKRKLVNGALAFDWDGLLAAQEKLTRQIDDAANAYKARTSAEFRGLDQLMRDLRSALKAAKVAWKKAQVAA